MAGIDVQFQVPHGAFRMGAVDPTLDLEPSTFAELKSASIQETDSQ
jgi:hypothetical protein